MTLLVSFSIAKMSPPNEGDIIKPLEDDEGDIDRWENDGGKNYGTIYDRCRN